MKGGETMRRVLSIVLIVLLLATSLSYAGTLAISKSMKLTFSGTTANCLLTVKSYGNPINATLKLYNGTTQIDSWSTSGNNSISISETHNCVSGQTYRLEADVTVNGLPVNVTPVTKTCP